MEENQYQNDGPPDSALNAEQAIEQYGKQQLEPEDVLAVEQLLQTYRKEEEKLIKKARRGRRKGRSFQFLTAPAGSLEAAPHS